MRFFLQPKHEQSISKTLQKHDAKHYRKLSSSSSSWCHQDNHSSHNPAGVSPTNIILWLELTTLLNCNSPIPFVCHCHHYKDKTVITIVEPPKYLPLLINTVGYNPPSSPLSPRIFLSTLHHLTRRIAIHGNPPFSLSSLYNNFILTTTKHKIIEMCAQQLSHIHQSHAATQLM